MQYERGKLINDGGEGQIFEVKNNSTLLMKIYKDKDLHGKKIVTKELQQKVEYMKNHPPVSLLKKGCLAWPIEIIYKNGKMIGFTMPKLKTDSSLLQIYSYKHPLLDSTYDLAPSIQSRIGIAINLTYAISELHKAGYVIGDLNHENIGVNKKNGQIQIFDCDSFTIIDDKKNTFRTKVCMPGYLAPEIIRHCNSERLKGNPYNLDTVILPTFSKESDLFCLAIHIFKSLLNGISPFLGVQNNAVGSTAAPFMDNEGIERNNYVFKQGLHPSAVYCLKENEIPTYVKILFDKAFLDGNNNPKSRPSTGEWYEALTKYLSSIKQCSNNPKHQYYSKLSYCPFCTADENHYRIQNGGTSQPKTSFNNRFTPKPILVKKISSTNYNQITKTQKQSNYQYNTSSNQLNHNKKNKKRNIIIISAAIIFCVIFSFFKSENNKNDDSSKTQVKTEQVQTKKQNESQINSNQNNSTKSTTQNINQKKFEQQKTSLENIKNEKFNISKYVSTNGLNARSGPDVSYRSLFVIPQNAIVYLSSSRIKGAWNVIKYKDKLGWVNKTCLRDFTIESESIKIGNHSDDGYWITKPGNSLYSSEMEHLGIEFSFATLNEYSENTKILLMIITPDNDYIQGDKAPIGYSEQWNINIKSGTHSYGTFDIPSYYYRYNPGVWFIRVYYENPNNPKNTLACIASKKFILY